MVFDRYGNHTGMPVAGDVYNSTVEALQQDLNSTQDALSKAKHRIVALEAELRVTRSNLKSEASYMEEQYQANPKPVFFVLALRLF